MRGVLGDIDGRAAIFAAERKALQHAHRDEQDRRPDPDLFRRWQRPIANVAKPMIVIVIRTRLCPVESPILPNTNAPIGRTMKPTAKVSSVKTNVCASGRPAKKTGEITDASAP